MRFIDRTGFAGVLDALARRGFTVVGPTVRDGAVVLDRVEGVDDLPAGVGVDEGPGRARLERRDDDRLFGVPHGPDSAKRFLFPARERLATLVPDAERGFSVEVSDRDVPRYAFVGLRACDLAAVATQDQVFLGGDHRDGPYAARREGSFFLAVQCTEPGPTCFCASMGTGPRCATGYDLALTELPDGFVVEVGTPAGQDVLDEAGSREATEDEASAAEASVREAAARMGREVETGGLRNLLYRNRSHPRWAEVAERCLACGNCTAVCPTCFCHDVVDTPLVTGETERDREWASCFSEEFSHLAGHGPVRSSREARYRQWLTHKFAGWFDQFGTSGCVGCGRCIAWCPVGIDVTEELAAIRRTDHEAVPA